MKPRFIALNLLLVAGIGVVVWQARARWNEARETRLSALNVKVKPAGLPPLAPAPKPDAPPATNYVEVATKNLFSKDRNPTVVIDPPKVEKPREMPPLPVVYGVLGLPSGIKALMAEKAGAPSRPVRAGDTIGEFKIASLDPQTVVFNWEGKDVSRKIEDLMDRTNHGGPAGGPAVVASAAPGGVASQQPVQQPQPVNNPPPPNAPNRPLIGVDVGTAGRAERICQPGDTTPAGSVVDGYRKVVISTPFGASCRWVSAQ